MRGERREKWIFLPTSPRFLERACRNGLRELERSIRKYTSSGVFLSERKVMLNEEEEPVQIK